MAKLLDMILDNIDFESVCRLCLTQNGIMSSIYDNSRKSTLSERILSLASVQIMPDDGLPGLICHSCLNQVEKFIKFREQIEHSYFLLCQCIGIDPTETESISTSDVNVLHIPECSAQHKTKGKVKQKPRTAPLKIAPESKDPGILLGNHDDLDPLSLLLKEHYLEATASSNNLLVNPADVTVNRMTYESIPESDVLSLALGNGNLDLNPTDTDSLLVKDLTPISSQCSLDNVFDSVHKPISSDEKIYNVPFGDNPDEALPDIFQCLDNEEDANGFDVISKYLKSSQCIDTKKLKEEIKTLKIKNENTTFEDVTSNDASKKLADNIIVVMKTEITEEANNVISIPDKVKVLKKFEHISMIHKNEPHMIINPPAPVQIKTEIVVPENGSKEEAELVEQANEVFAEMQIEVKEIYTEANDQEEIVPRITEIYTFIQEANEEEVKSEQDLLTFTKFMCHLCLSEFDDCDYESLKKHSDGHFNEAIVPVSAINQQEAPFTCEICAKIYQHRHEFIIHQRDHLGVKPFVCKVCHRGFAWAVKLAEHTARHTSQEKGLEPFCCPICGKIFNKKNELQYHERTHQPKNSLICPTCNKIFSNSITLRMHRRRHTEGTKYPCDQCGKSFFYRTELRRHEQSHSGVRKFPCHLCDKAFCSNAERRRHLLYHFKTKNFKCHECDKRFYESGHLNIHMRAHTNFKPHICEVCGKAFPTKIKLLRHLKMHTRDSPTPSELRDQILIKNRMSKTKSDTVVAPKFNSLSSVSSSMIKAVYGSMQPEVSTDLPLIGDSLNLPDFEGIDEGQSYIIIEGDESNCGDSNPDLSAFSKVQMFTDDKGEVFYILDGEDFAGLSSLADYQNGAL